MLLQGLLYASAAGWVVFIIFLLKNLRVLPQPARKPEVQSFATVLIVPFRNEAPSLPNTLESCLKQRSTVPNLKAIFVNDHSSDGGEKIVSRFAEAHPELFLIVNLNAGSAGKKAAQLAALEKIEKADYIALFDADCQMPSEWLAEQLGAAASNHADIVLGPVLSSPAHSLAHALYGLELLNLAGVTQAFANAGKPIMANGANLLFKRPLGGLFKETLENGIASGDDTFFVQRASAEGAKVCFHWQSGNEVISKPPISVNELVNQRVRWAGKTLSYQFSFPKIVAGWVALINALQLVSIGLFCISPEIAFAAVVFWVAKITAEYMLHRHLAIRSARPQLAQYSALGSVLYPFYVVAMACVSLLKQEYKWKGREWPTAR